MLRIAMSCSPHATRQLPSQMQRVSFVPSLRRAFLSIRCCRVRSELRPSSRRLACMAMRSPAVSDARSSRYGFYHGASRPFRCLVPRSEE